MMTSVGAFLFGVVVLQLAVALLSLPSKSCAWVQAFLGMGSSRSHVQALSHSCFSFLLGCLPHGESAARLASVSAGRLGAIDFEPP